MKKIICGKENFEEFRAEIKAALPGFYTLAKDLYQSGLITGLAGATIEPLAPQSIEQNEIDPLAQNLTPSCKDCTQWQRDKIGDGTGIGLCLLNIRPDLLKWPNREACNQFARG